MKDNEESRDDLVDRLIRRELEPDPRLSRRVMRGALESIPTRRSRSLWLGAGLLGAAVAMVLLLAWPRAQESPPESDGAATLSAERGTIPCLEIRSVGDLVVVRSPSGQVLAVASGGAS